MAQLELRNLQKKYSDRVIPVNNITLTVDDGEFLTLLGPSGCGKTTLLRLIAGLEQPTQGQILIDGQLVNTLSPGDRNIAMVFQSYALYPHMSVAENISTTLKLKRLPKGEIQRRVMAVAAKLELTPLLSRQPKQLSGGQRQRVALARALVRQPEIFLLDEPLSNLDALLREQVRAELKQLFNTQHKPVVYVTHDQTEAMTLSSKVAVLAQGQLQQLASPRDIYAKPANQFVAGFVGSPQMNFLRLPCPASQVTVGQVSISLPLRASFPSEVILGIRPEDVGLAQVGAPQTIQGNILLLESLGKVQLVTVKITATPLTIRAMVPADHHQVGEAIALTLPSESLHWFDAKTGDRLA